jgi:DNA polymerase III sliding clamp (beta) subunit (PCNA family)
MLDALRFIRGAVSKKDFLPVLTHFRIQSDVAYADNGAVSICTPIFLGFDCTPKALPLLKALQHATDADTVQLSLTKANRLLVKIGTFKASVECLPDAPPIHTPQGALFNLDGKKFLTGITKLRPFIGNDASRPWCNGILISPDKLSVTNNILFIETQYTLNNSFTGKLNLPAQAIDEMLRIGEPPEALQVDDTSVAFWYSGDRWLRAQLLPAEWPDTAKLFENKKSNFKPALTALFFEAVEKLLPFADELRSVHLTSTGLATHTEDHTGAAVALDAHALANLPAQGRYNGDALLLLKNIAPKIDFSTYPAPVLFSDGAGLRGALVGLRI